MTKKRYARCLGAVLAAAVALVAGFWLLRHLMTTEYRRYRSPDQRFEIVVFREPMLIGMPGQSGDASGYFQLRDVRTGRVLQQCDVEMVQLVDVMNIDWYPDRVSVQLLADWQLPR